jgi:PAS domain S-box-containing protein
MRDNEAWAALVDVVDAAIAISSADFGNIQLVDIATSRLRIAAQRGFPQWWVDYWNAELSSGACHQAFERGERVIVEDVEQDPLFVGTPALQIHRQAHVRAVQSTPIRGRAGKLLGILSTHFRAPHQPDARELRLLDLLARQIADILERIQAEVALRESEAQLRMALQGARAAAWQWNIEADELIWSPESYAMHGRTPEEGRPKYHDWLESLHPEDRASADRLIREVMDKRIPDYRTEYRVVLPSGEIRWLSGKGKVDFAADGSPLLMAGINLDITDQKRAELSLFASEAALRQTQERLRFAAKAGRLTYVDIDVVAGTAYRAENYGEVMGYMPVTPVGGGDLKQGIASLLGHVAPADRPRVQEAFRAALQEGLSGRSEFHVIADDRRERWIEGAWSVGVGADGKPERIFVTALDVTELVESRNALAEAKAEAERAAQAKSHFLATASHDLRQPVQSLVLLFSVLERQVAGSSKAADTVRMMYNALQGLQGLLTGVLDISRLDAGVVTPTPEIIDLDVLLRRLGAEYAPNAAERGLEIRVVSRSICTRADASLLERALRNLIENALRYTLKGGIILGLRLRGPSVRIDVIDTGVGVPIEKQSEIFEEFHQLNNPGRNLSLGLGLGLAIVARLAKLLCADVEVASKVGRGSRFSLSLPAVEGSIATDGETRDVEDVPAGRILVVEDNEIVRTALEAALQDWGYLTLCAADGEIALDMLASAGDAVDLVIADYRLGAGRNGVETVKAIEARLSRPMPAILLTGDIAKERIAEIASSGMELLHKPVTHEELRRKIASMLFHLGDLDASIGDEQATQNELSGL